MLQHRFTLELFADFHQFYVLDAGAYQNIPEEWTDQDVQARAKVADQVVVICPARNITVPVMIELFDADPCIDWVPYDHVVLCSLNLPSGELRVEECTGREKLRQSMRPVRYSVLALYSGLGTLDETGLKGDDAYRVVLWPAPESTPLSVLKAWPPPAFK